MFRPSGCQFQYRKDFSCGKSFSVSLANINKVLSFFSLLIFILSQNSFREVNVWSLEMRRILQVFQCVPLSLFHSGALVCTQLLQRNGKEETLSVCRQLY